MRRSIAWSACRQSIGDVRHADKKRSDATGQDQPVGSVERVSVSAAVMIARRLL